MQTNRSRPRLLVVDDDQVVRRSLTGILGGTCEVLEAESGEVALRLLDDERTRPDIILLDVRMPGMNGYEVCAKIQERDDLAYIPVVFVTSLGSEEDRKKAFDVGGAAYIHKPFEADAMIAEVERQLETQGTWRSLRATARHNRSWLLPSTFVAFKQYLEAQKNASSTQAAACHAVQPADVYDLGGILRIPNDQLARHMSHFLGLPYSNRFYAEDVGLGVLPKAFCESNLVLPLRDRTIVLSNPFDWELMHTLDQTLWHTAEPKLSLAEPERIRLLLEEPSEGLLGAIRVGFRTISLESEREESGEMDALTLVGDVLREAVQERASDVHIEPKEHGALIRFRIDGDMQDIRTIGSAQVAKMLSRLKALAGMDIAERRKPQDGALMASLKERRYKLRLATSSTTGGETIVIRILDPDAEVRPLEELGMTDAQSSLVRELASRSQGTILVVGPTGSGKSTTIFTLLTTVDGQTRSIMSVEDPVEYRIPYANQQQVNQRAGVTFEALLKSAVRQDPDILFLGEVRDPFSARAVLEFASSGHLTISSLHSSNATTAIFRLERLGIERGAMADSIAAVVAQKLLKKLCPDCKRIAQTTSKERELLRRFTNDVPETLAHPVGCPACRDTGFRGREGVYEMLVFDRDVGDLVRDGRGIAEIRAHCANRNDYLVSDHALEKLRAHKFALRDVVDDVLLEESVPPRPIGPSAAAGAGSAAASVDSNGPTGKEGDGETPHDPEAPSAILVVDDDEDMRALLELHLTGAGHRVIGASDGVDALMLLAQGAVDLVLSDVNMPNLDGLKLIEIMRQKQIDVPTLFLTASEDAETEEHVLAHGAFDYIRKPVRKEVLLLRVANALRARDNAAPVPGKTS
jgi:type IV pilus assembly protein PilB